MTKFKSGATLLFPQFLIIIFLFCNLYSYGQINYEKATNAINDLVAKNKFSGVVLIAENGKIKLRNVKIGVCVCERE